MIAAAMRLSRPARSRASRRPAVARYTGLSAARRGTGLARSARMMPSTSSGLMARTASAGRSRGARGHRVLGQLEALALGAHAREKRFGSQRVFGRDDEADRRGHLRQKRDRVDREHAVLDRAHDGYQARLGLLGGGGLLALVLREFERHLPQRDHSRGRLVLGEPFERGSRLEQRGRERDHPCAAFGHRRRTAQRDRGAEAIAGEASRGARSPTAR